MSIEHLVICDKCGAKEESEMDECEDWNCPEGWSELLQPNPYKKLWLHMCNVCIKTLTPPKQDKETRE